MGVTVFVAILDSVDQCSTGIVHTVAPSRRDEKLQLVLHLSWLYVVVVDGPSSGSDVLDRLELVPIVEA